jgi:hypothetical protein
MDDSAENKILIAANKTFLLPGFHGTTKAEIARTAGVNKIGISVTETARDHKILLTNNKFYQYYFEEMGATHVWQFQLMPIGNSKDLMELMITSKQLVKLYKKWEYVARTLCYPMAYFWNSSSLCSWCLAYGRWSGYFNIDLDGKNTSCVFVPYCVDKIQDINENRGTLADALQTEFFKNGRKWQKGNDFAKTNHLGEYLMMHDQSR